MAYIDTEKLIEAVKRRPALYNKDDSSYYHHRKQKSKVWIEACKDVYENWDQLRPQDRIEYCHDLQKRWKSLRTCFTREIQLQKREKLKQEEEGKPIKRRKRYEYFSMMSFLLDPSTVTAGEDIRETDEDSFDPLDSLKTEAVYAESAEMSTSSQLIVEPNGSSHYEKYYERSDKVEAKVLEMLREIKRDEEDEDRQFMLSLVPSFRKLKDKQKFEAKIEILRVLKDISFQEKE